MIRLSPEFTGLEGLGNAAVAKGVCGEIAGLSIVKVPASYMPKSCFFIIAHKSAVLMPYKISDAKVHNDPVGVSGALIEGRHYYDAFVLGAKSKGVYACVLADEKLPAPTKTEKDGTVTLSAANSGAEIIFTTDGSDPRYSDSAKVYSGAFASKVVDIKAFARLEGKYNSDVA